MVRRTGDHSDRNIRKRFKRGKENRPPMLSRVRLADVDRSDDLFFMSFEPDLGRLRESVNQIGILEPIWLRAKGSGFQIINGFRRFDVAKALKMRMIPALVWREGKIDDRIAFEMGLHGNMLTRGLNLVEKAMVLGKLLSLFSASRDEVIQTWLPLLNHDPNEKVLSSLLTINSFSRDARGYLLSHGLSLNNIMLLAKFSEDERPLICRVLSPLKIGENVLREILTHLREIALRDGVGTVHLLSDSKIQDTLSDHRLSGPQKIEAIRRSLRERRYPRLSKLEDEFQVCKKEMRLPPQIEISPPPFFEGDRFKIQFHFGTQKEYETILGALQRILRGSIGNLMSLKGYGSDTF